MSFRLPLWVYWTLAGLGVAGALVVTVLLDLSEIAPWEARKLLFTIWGGPLTLVIAASIVTLLSRSQRPKG